MYSKKEDGFSVVVMKPFVDKKGGESITSRDKSEYKVDFVIRDEDNIYNIISRYLIDNNLDFILVDEAQFLGKHHIDELSDIVDILGISVICYGLRTDFKGELFEGSKRLFEVSDTFIELERQCSCGKKKIYNMRMENGIPVFSGEQIAIDGVEATYESKCRSCYKRMKRKYKDK
jgi:thymidine kinase